MNGIKELVFSLCLVSVIAGVFRLLAPSGGLQKTAVMVMGLFTLVCFLAPFTADFDFDSLFSFSLEELTPSDNFVAQSGYDFEQAAVDEVTQAVTELAKKEGVSVTVTGVKLSKQEQGVLVDTITLIIEGNERQAVSFKNKVSEIVKCEVSVAWTKE